MDASWSRAGGYLQINSRDIEQTIRLLQAQQFSLEGLFIKSANLDDLFLKLTGHSLSA